MLDRIWLQMAARYGVSWTSQHGDAPDSFTGAEWRETLAGISPQQIKDGFAHDVLRADKWPPTSTMFRAMCLSEKLPERELTVAEIAAAKTAEHAEDLAFFQRQRELCLARGLDLWEHESIHGIPHNTRPVPANPAHVAKCMAEMDKLLGAMRL